MEIVSEETARAVVSLDDAIEAVAQAFIDLSAGRAELFPVALGRGADTGRFGAKLGREGVDGTPGLKIGTYWPGNRAKGLAAHGSTTLLLDPGTGFPAALVAATYLTAIRTAAADAVAVRALARPDASRLLVIGSGHQAYWEARAVARVRPLTDIAIAGRSNEGAAKLARMLAEEGYPARPGTVASDAATADLIVTVTPSHVPLIGAEQVRAGTHVSAMGADEPGKAELDPALFDKAALFADLPAQSAAIGEFSQAVAQGLPLARITALGDVLRGIAAGRQSADLITIFDSSGTALQDLAVARLALARARAAGTLQTIDIG
ncbi:ornithine cyclodeaminase family protein [Sandaracinobacteroides saxicola]|uniref:Ornithine cyclodeaminase family protein n=1 Tax=Sandaracinobacteroides saxicola TaxID=2759707 RepID=A0A7G5IMK1_9SPHN|nr:ornithine cyclodeaminase family protein [Sandaracinobacteroides saxicola]